MFGTILVAVDGSIIHPAKMPVLLTG